MAGLYKFGSEFVINPLAIQDQFLARTAAFGDGRFIMTWTQQSVMSGVVQSDVLVQSFNADGSAASGAVPVMPLGGTNESASSVKVLANGNYVVTWTSAAPDALPSHLDSIQAQVFRADGSRLGSVITVTSPAAPLLTQTPMVQALPDGKFALMWSEYGRVFATLKIQTFNANGTPVAAASTVTDTADSFPGAALTRLADGHLLANWDNDMVRLLNSDGTPAADAVQLGMAPGSMTKYAALAGGGFVASYIVQTFGPGGTGQDVYAQSFHADGQPAGTAVEVNVITVANQTVDDVVGLSDGRYMVLWTDTSRSPDDTSSTAVRGRVMNADGTASSGEFLVNTVTGGGQAGGRASELVDERLMVTWASDVVRSGVHVLETHAQIFDPRMAAISVSGTGAGEQFVGTAFDDRINGAGGTDRLAGGDGADVLNGGNAADVLRGQAGTDTLLGGAGSDRLDGGGGKDVLTGGAGADVFAFASATETGKGTTADTITDFASGTDNIDLSTIAHGAAFIGGAAFHGTGTAELRFDPIAHVLSGDTDGNGSWNFSITVLGSAPVAADLIL